jgi:uncharacterized protein
MNHIDGPAKTIHVGMLLDFYGQLLTPKAQQIMALYFDDDWSLSEISCDCKISRQGVHDTIKRSVTALESYEERLKLVTRFIKQQEYIRQAICDMDNNRLIQAKERLLELGGIL